MQLNSDALDAVKYLVGSEDEVIRLSSTPSLSPFCTEIIDFLNDVSKEIMSDSRSKAFSDVVTFAFWIRKASVLKMKERFSSEGVHLGKGVVFHIAPSNVPVNFAYSLACGLICGNSNVVRVPSKDFPQVDIITDAFNKALSHYEKMKSYVLCVRYDRNKDINDLFSLICDMRIVWGGDQTNEELRKSPLPPRSGEITFADRYSFAIIDSDAYLSIEDKDKVAEGFYNDTFFTDQNACTSPRVIVWTGKEIEKAKELFWSKEHNIVEKKYSFQPILGVNKLTKAYIVASLNEGIRIEGHEDNLIIRVKVNELFDTLMDYKDNGGYFYEYDCSDYRELIPLCNDKRCQTVAYIGNKDMVEKLIETGIKGIDRVVPIGKTMDFDLIWDGYNMPNMLTRTISV